MICNHDCGCNVMVFRVSENYIVTVIVIASVAFICNFLRYLELRRNHVGDCNLKPGLKYTKTSSIYVLSTKGKINSVLLLSTFQYYIYSYLNSSAMFVVVVVHFLKELTMNRPYKWKCIFYYIQKAGCSLFYYVHKLGVGNLRFTQNEQKQRIKTSFCVWKKKCMRQEFIKKK